MSKENCICESYTAKYRCRYYVHGEGGCDRPAPKKVYYKSFFSLCFSVLVYNQPITQAQAGRIFKRFPRLVRIEVPHHTYYNPAATCPSDFWQALFT